LLDKNYIVFSKDGAIMIASDATFIRFVYITKPTIVYKHSICIKL